MITTIKINDWLSIDELIRHTNKNRTFWNNIRARSKSIVSRRLRDGKEYKGRGTRTPVEFKTDTIPSSWFNTL